METTTTGRTILVIDEDLEDVDAIRALLECEGYTVHWADSGRHGLEVLRELHPDAVILDVRTERDIEGVAARESARYTPELEGLHDVPVLIVSSRDEVADERLSRAIGAGLLHPDVYLMKPLEHAALLDAVRRATRRH